MSDDSLTDADGAPSFSGYVSQGAEIGGQLGEVGGAAAGEALGEHFGMGEMLSHFVGETVGEPLGELAGGAVGAVAYAGAETAHLVGEFDDWASGHGGTDPLGGGLPPGGAPDNPTTPDPLDGGAGGGDSGADQGGGDYQDQTYDGGVDDQGG